MAVLVGDTSANGSVNATDVTQTKTESGHSITASNFREDVSVNGVLNSTDVGIVKAASRNRIALTSHQSCAALVQNRASAVFFRVQRRVRAIRDCYCHGA